MSLKNTVQQAIGDGNANTKTLPRDFIYKKVLLSNYFLLKNDGQNYICANIDYSLKLDNPQTECRCSTPDLLCSILTLREHLSNDLFLPLEKNGFIECRPTQKQIELIIQWCKQNGYPFCIEQRTQQNKKFKAGVNRFEHLNLDSYTVYFDVLDFLKEVDEIYSAFWLYRTVVKEYVTGDECKIPQISVSNIRRISKETGYEYLGYYPMPKRREDCQNLFIEKFSQRRYTCKLYADPDLLYTPEITSGDLFDAAFYQLASLLTSPGRQIKLCPMCKKYFEPESGHDKYCNYKNEKGHRTCSAQKKYKQRKRSEK